MGPEEQEKCKSVMILDGLKLERDDKAISRFQYWFHVIAKKKDPVPVDDTSDFIGRVVLDSPEKFRG